MKLYKKMRKMKKSTTNKKKTGEYSSRLKEMTAILRKYEVTKGISPEKLRKILEELGPTYIKLGQLMSTRSDMLPQAYCEELGKLCTRVAPMSFAEVEKEIRSAYGHGWREDFTEIEGEPLGAASIAQVHKAALKSGEPVVIKVQRPNIYRQMEQDISMLRKAVRFLPPLAWKEMVDLDSVLSELWAVAQEELNFLTEAANIEEFTSKNTGIEYIGIPKLYREYTTSKILVMEYIEGCAIDDRAYLMENGYDLHEVGSKLVDHFMKQVLEDGFFHGDPHPGNIRVRGGKIVWLDMGMMGRLTKEHREEIKKAVRGIAFNDITMVEEAVLKIGTFRAEPDRPKLHRQLQEFLNRYGTVDMGKIDVIEVLQDMMQIMKENKISMPAGLTMLVRGLTHMEGVLAEISPEINIVSIAAARMKEDYLEKEHWKKTIKKEGMRLQHSISKAIDLPGILAELLEGYTKGENGLHMNLHVSREFAVLLARLVRNIVLGLWVMALLISSSIICTTKMQPQFLGIPALGALGYFMAVVIMVYVFLRHIFSKK